MNREKFEAQQDPTRPLKWIRWTTHARVFDVWDQAFDVSFFEYRRRLQELALETYRAAAGARVTVGLTDAASWLAQSEDEILVPTDDDDFFSPHLADVAAAFDEDTNVVIWPTLACGFVESESKRKVLRSPWPILNMNNFAVRKSYLIEHFENDMIVRMLAHHYTANRRIAQQLGFPEGAPKLWNLPILRHPTVRRIRRCFSMYNYHPGSIFFLHRLLDGREPVDTLRRLDLDEPVRLPRYARPFEAYVRRLEGEGRALRVVG